VVLATPKEKHDLYLSPKEHPLCDVPILRIKKRRFLFFGRSPESTMSILVTNYRILCVRKDWDKKSNLACQRVFSLSLKDIAYVDVSTRWGLGVQELGIDFRSSYSSLFTLGSAANFFARLFSVQKYISLVKVGEIGQELMRFITEARINSEKTLLAGSGARRPVVSAADERHLQELKKERDGFFTGIQEAIRAKDWHRAIQLCEQSEERFGFSGDVAQAYAVAKKQVRIQDLKNQLNEGLQEKEYDTIVVLCDALLEEEPDSKEIQEIKKQYLPHKEQKDAQKQIKKAVAEKRLTEAQELLQAYLAQYPEDNEASQLAKQLGEKIPLYVEHFKKHITNLLDQKRLAEAVEFFQSEPKWVSEHPEVSHYCAAGVLLLESFELREKGKTSAALRRLQKAVSLKYNPEYVQHAIGESKHALRIKRSKYRKKFFIPALVILVLAAGLLVTAYTVMLSADLFLISIILLVAALSMAMIGLFTSFLIKDTPTSVNNAQSETDFEK
jgi:hypothetical protein